MSELLAELAKTVGRSNGLESLTRPLLELLESLTGLESTYLTRVDEGLARQQVLYARNVGGLTIPEGVEVPWRDTLCRRALDEAVPFSADVPHRFSDCEAAQALGITTYLTSPVRDTEGRLLGTLCAASREPRSVPEETFDVLTLFSRLIAQQIEREALVEKLARANALLRSQAATDALTELPNRRALVQTLSQRLREAKDHQRQLVVAFVDLDGFKAINDTHGHVVGDRFLQAVGARLGSAMRPGDVVGRYGGDEFLVLFETAMDDHHAAEHLRDRLEAACRGRFELGDAAFDYAGASVGVAIGDPGGTDADALIAAADAAMYERKQARRSDG